MDQPLVTPSVAEDDDTLRDRPFNAYRFAASDEAKAIVAEAIGLLSTYERRFNTRKNKRRPEDQKTFEMTVDAVLSDLLYHHFTEFEGGVYVTRSNQVLGTRSRYRPRVYSKALPKILDLMAKPEMALIQQQLGKQQQIGRSRSTVIAPGAKLLSCIDEHDLSLDDLDEHPHSETIILKRPKDDDDYWDEGGLQEYEDTEHTERLRCEMDEINHWLASANLGFDHGAALGFGYEIDIQSRRLRRIFTRGRFDSGGRLFGGFWQELGKGVRRAALFISGEKAIELDYGQVGPRILYGMAGHEPPTDDLYAIWGYGNHRDGIKKVMNAMIFASRPLTRFPKQTRKLFRSGDRIGEVVEAIEQQHPLIKDRFYRGLGHHTQFIESQTMVDVLLTLKSEDVVALPIHDAVMVPASKASIAKEVMLSTFSRHAHVEGQVTMED